MMRLLLKISLIAIVLGAFLHAEVPTKNSVTKLYVATFNRAPDAAGLDYWLNSSGLQLEEIAQSFFDQPETQAKYPEGSTNIEFVTAVYNNLFNRDPEPAGSDYWIGELNSGSVAKPVFILAVINGAQDTELGNDATILENKTIVGLAFADAGLDDVQLAIEIMSGITDDTATVTAALEEIGLLNISFSSDVMPIFVDVDKGYCISCHSTSSNRTFKVDDAAYTYNNIIVNNLINTASPDSSLLLIKGNGGSGHNGGDKLSDENSNIIRNWIIQGGLNN